MKQHCSRRARSALLWAAALFVLGQLAVGLVLDYAWTSVRFPTAAALVQRFAGMTPAPQIVVVGSSRFGGALPVAELQRALQEEFGPDAAPPVFNASTPAGDLIAAEFVINALLETGGGFKLLVVEVSPETVNHYNEWLLYHVRRQLRWDHVPETLGDIWFSRQFLRFVSARLLPLQVHRRQLWQKGWAWLTAWLPPAAAAAPSPPPNVAVIDWDRLIGRAQNGPGEGNTAWTQAGLYQPRRWLRHYGVGGLSTVALERLLRTCLDRDIDVILVGVPVTLAHRQCYTPEINTAFLDYMKRLTQTYRCRFVDYRDRVPDGLFMDNHHVIIEGSVYFSSLVTKEVLAPAWRARLADQ